MKKELLKNLAIMTISVIILVSIIQVLNFFASEKKICVVNRESKLMFCVPDLNKDGKANLTDLSISAYRQGE